MVGRLRSRGLEVVFPALIALALAIPVGRSPLVALAGAAALVVLALVLFNAGALLLLLVACFPWDDMLGFPSATVSVIKLLGALLVLAYVLHALARNEELRLPATLPAVTVFTMLVLVSLLGSDDPAAGLNKTLRYALFAAFFVLLVQLVRSRAQVLALLRVLVISSTAAAVVGIANFVTGADGRVEGPIGEANDFAYLLASVLPLAVYLLQRDRRFRPAWIVCCCVLVGALLGTLSRGALVGIAALILWAVATRRIRLGGIVAAGVVVAGTVALALTLWQPLINERLQQKQAIAGANVASRQAYWSAAVRMSADHPLLGVGPGRFGEVSRTYVRNDPIGIRDPVAHNSYLEVLAEGGIPMLLAFLAFVAGSWQLSRTAVRRFRADHDADGVRLAGAVQAALVVAIVSANFLSVQITAPLWLLGGLAAVLALARW